MPTEPVRRRREDATTHIRTVAVWRSVSELATRRSYELSRPLHIADLGGGSGGMAVPLAEAGHQVTVIDPSPDALASLGRRAAEAGVAAQLHGIQGDDSTLTELAQARPIDLVCCHGALEIVDDPDATVARISAALDPGAALSLLTAQRFAAVIARALAGRFDQALAALTSEAGTWADHDSLARRFDRDTLLAMLRRHNFTVSEISGARIFSDIVPSASIDSESERQGLLALEDAVRAHPTAEVLSSLAAALHVTAFRR